MGEVTARTFLSGDRIVGFPMELLRCTFVRNDSNIKSAQIAAL